MSALYLDILKDRLYTFAADSPQRRAGQTVMAHILSELLRLTAPILPFTCDEAWSHLPAHLREVDTIHLSRFPDPRPEYRMDNRTLTTWNDIIRIRGCVTKALEEARRAKLIGSSVEAAVRITPGASSTAELLDQFKDRLPELCIVPKVTIEPVSKAAQDLEGGVSVAVERAPGRKCTRCWNVRESVGDHPEHPEVCQRCLVQLGVLGG